MRRRLSDLPAEAPEAKRSAPHQTLLSDLDTSTLFDLIPWLNTTSILRLMQMGDFIFACKLKSQITSLHYNCTNLERSSNFIMKLAPNFRWRWPSVLEANSYSLAKLASLRIDGVSKGAMHCDLSSLPLTITKLALTDITLVATSPQHLQFNLPHLDHLRVERVLAHVFIAAAGVATAYEEWLPNSLLNSPIIRVFRFASSRFNRYHVTCYQRDCIQAMPLLEKLTIPYSDHITTIWPIGLHTLHIREGDVLVPMKIPPSITTLIVNEHLPNDLLRSIIQSAPTSLTCLEADLLAGSTQAMLDELSRFTQLQSLHICRTSHNISTLDWTLSGLPKSVTVLSEPFAALPSTWRYIMEKHIQLKPRKTFIHDSDVDNRGMCRYDQNNDHQYAQYLPIDLTSIELFNSIVPTPNNRLRSIEMAFENSNLTNTPASKLLVNMTPHLTSLQLFIDDYSPKLFWIEDAETRFPNLKQLHLVVKSEENSFIPVKDICDWLARVPKSLTCLRLDLQLSYGDRYLNSDSAEMTLSLDDISLPSSLKSLALRLEDYSLGIPSVLPPSLAHVLFDFYDMKPTESAQNVALWPDTLKSIYLLAAHHNKPKVRALLTPPMQLLQSRMSKSKATISW